jgi:hypothetical protein
MQCSDEIALVSPSCEFGLEFLEVARESVSAGEDRYRDLLASGGDFANYVAGLERQDALCTNGCCGEVAESAKMSYGHY